MRRRLIVWFHWLRQRYIVRLMLAILLLLIAVYASTFFVLMRVLEHKPVSVWESVYWTINRLTTTGELPPQLVYTSQAIQALSILIQISGLSFVFAAFPLVIIPALEQRLRGIPVLLHPEMSGHILVCGYSPLVESLMDELAAGPRPFRVIDDDLEIIRRLREKNIHALYGDPTDEGVLGLAGIDKAAYVVANREDEEDNAKIVLTAAAGPAQIFALIDDLQHAHYFRYAGAHQVLSPKRMLGIYLAQKATASLRGELFGANQLITDYFIVELPIYPGSPFDGLSLREAAIPERSGASLIGIWHRGRLELEPGPDSRISAENVIIAVGRRDQLLNLQELTKTIEVPEVTARRHFVVAGFGDVGRAVKEVLDQQSVAHLFIDPRVKPGEYIKGDATSEEVLRLAKLAEASTFIVASHVDRDNIFSTLVARKLNPDLHILARANLIEATDNLYRAGADFVFSLSAVAGQMLAEMLVGDSVITLAEGLKVLTVPVGARLVGKTIGRARIRSRTGCTIVACTYPDGRLQPNPGIDVRLSAGMSLMVMGKTPQIEDFKRRYV